MSTITGTWDLTLRAPQGPVEAILDLSSPTGTMTTGGDTSDLLEFALTDAGATWKAKLTQPMPLTVDFDATVDGDQLVGTASVQSFVKIPFDGTRR